MNVLENLEPKRVFRFFEDLCAIPHGSHNTKGISDYCANFARERGLEYYQDSDNNIIIIKEATPGYEQAVPMILQGHLDMVCEKDASCTKNMETEGLDLAVDGDYVYAKGTTPGRRRRHRRGHGSWPFWTPRTSPTPAWRPCSPWTRRSACWALCPWMSLPLKGKKLLNLDSEVEGVFTVSCAGGNVTNCFLPVVRAPFEGTALTVTVSGLQGGHSGVEIHKGRANANMLLGRVLQAMDQAAPLRLVSAQGGMKDNAIPTLSSAQVVVSDEQAAHAAAEAMAAAFAGEFRVTDPKVAVTVEPCQIELAPMDQDSTQKAICMLTCLPNGVQVMSATSPAWSRPL